MVKWMFMRARRDGLRKTLENAPRELVGEIRFLIAKLSGAKSVQSVYGPKFSANYDDATFRFYINGHYHPFLSDKLKSLNRPFNFIDVGANQGLYALVAQSNAHCREVHAYEPVPSTFDLLVENVHLNKAGKVTPHNCAISNVEGELSISYRPRHSGGARISDERDGFLQTAIQSVTASTIDQHIPNTNAHDIFVKIDTEGHEPIVLAELRKAKLWRQVKYLYFEADNNRHETQPIVQELERDGFSEVWRTPDRTAHFDMLLERTS